MDHESRLAQTANARAAAFERFLREADELTGRLGDGPLSDAQRLDRAKHLQRAYLARLRMKARKFAAARKAAKS